MDELINYNGYEEFKQAVNRVLNRTVEDFVLTGYLLKQARDTDILKDSGYNDVNEFAWGEYKLDASQVSRYIRVNDKFSEGGYSPKLQEQYQGFGYAKLALMLTLPEEVVEELTPTYRDSGSKRGNRRGRENHGYRSNPGRTEGRTERPRQPGESIAPDIP